MRASHAKRSWLPARSPRCSPPSWPCRCSAVLLVLGRRSGPACCMVLQLRSFPILLAWSATSNVQLAVASTDCNWFTSSSGCTPGPLDHDRPSECPIPTRIANDSLGRLLPCHSGTPHHFPPIKGNIRWKHLQLPVGASPPPTASTLHPPRPPDPPSRPKRAPFRDDDLCPDPEGAHDSPASLVHELGQPKVRQKQAGASPPPPAPTSSTLRPPEPPFRPQHTPFDNDGPCPHPGGARDNAALLGLQLGQPKALAA